MHSLELKAATAMREQAETTYIPNPPCESATLNIPLISMAELKLYGTDSQSSSIVQDEQHFWDVFNPTSDMSEIEESPEVNLE